MLTLALHDVARIPMPGDNAAIATRRLTAGARIGVERDVFTLTNTVLEGHRFAIREIPAGGQVLSWGLPFGLALRDIHAGEYLCNAGILEALGLRNLDFPLPGEPNFQDFIKPYELNEASFQPGAQVSPHARCGTFEGFARPGGRGVGTRNFIVVLGTTSLTASYAAALAARCKPASAAVANLDGIAAVGHTEGGGSRPPNNREFVLRTLAGFMVHPNVGAVLAVDYGTEVLTNAMLEAYLRQHGYPIDHVPHRFLSLQGDFGAGLDEGERIVRSWFADVGRQTRSRQPLAALRVGLQCGGSDAFSGVSGNPLAGWVAREVIRHSGSANLAETDELIGAESYILSNTRDLDTAKCFLGKIATFRERVGWHGQSAEGNPSGGNKFRGLYNIAIKSIGAARKKDPDVRLDYVIDYSQPMQAPGFYFMDSPGNDLESVAGQVAAGCNVIFFTTGNGSITNFPFVPTIKFMTTTPRFNLLSRDMDVNAGRYLDGVPMDALGEETFDYTVRVASGMPSVGDRAGHSQVSIWRDWRQTDASQLEALRSRRRPDGKPIAIPVRDAPGAHLMAQLTERGYTTDHVGLIVPTSLCSGQIARRIADELNAAHAGNGHGVNRFVALVHTEGCGASSGENEDHYTRTMIGHLVHPFVRKALLLEHGCERTHNDKMRHELKAHGINPDHFGFASVQMDGGIEKVVARVENWFREGLEGAAPAGRREAGLEALSLGLLCVRSVPPGLARALAWLCAAIVGGGGRVVMPANSSLLESPVFLEEMRWFIAPAPSLEYGQVAELAGMHIMATPTDHLVESLTGLGGTGVQLILACVESVPLQGHPMIPVLQIATDAGKAARFSRDLDRILPAGSPDPSSVYQDLLGLLCETASRNYLPRLWESGNTDFQMTRGLLGVSL